jgi:polyhydroxybutyrate depolymerase
VYAAGKSNGGGFTAYLACRQDTSTLFAAFAPVSPALYPASLAFSGCNPARPVPIINSHGVIDGTIPFNGRNDSVTGKYGVGTSTINVPQWRSEWAVRNGGYPIAEASITSAPNTTEEIFNGKATFIAFSTSNLDHSWPTTQGLDASGAPHNKANFNITDPSILAFFTANQLPSSYLRV